MSNGVLDRDDQQTHGVINHEVTPIGKMREWQAPSLQTVQQRQQQAYDLPPDFNAQEAHEVRLSELAKQLAEKSKATHISEAQITADKCQNAMMLGRSLIAERDAVIGRYQGRSYRQGSILERVWQGAQNVVKPKISTEEAIVLFRTEESKICGEKVFNDTNTRFFCVEPNRWMFSRLNEEGQVQESLDYLIRGDCVIVRQVDYADRVLRGKEFNNFCNAVKVSYQTIQAEYAKI